MASLGKDCARLVCSTCKMRKKGCDKQLPSCGYCTKRNLVCIYDDSPANRTSDGPIPCGFLRLGSSSSADELLKPIPTSIKAQARNCAAATFIGIPAFGSRGCPDTSATPILLLHDTSDPSAITNSLGHFNMEDMILWHQFMTETAATMTGPGEKEFPSLAFSSDYLMHGILSIAALHLAYLNPGQKGKYEYLFAQHQHVALGPFRRAMSIITSENCDQVFAFSMLMIIAQFAPSRSSDAMSPYADVSLCKGPANWIECLRGCGSIYRQAASHINSGPFGDLFAQGIRLHILVEEVTQLSQNEDDESLKYLSRHLLNLQCIKDSTTVAEMEAYTESISLLRKLLAVSSAASDSLGCRILSSYWPVRISDTFIRMLHEERPPALIITAHYCLLLKRCHSCWYMEHRAYDLFKDVEQSLADEWTPYLDHPLRVVGDS